MSAACDVHEKMGTPETLAQPAAEGFSKKLCVILSVVCAVIAIFVALFSLLYDSSTSAPKAQPLDENQLPEVTNLRVVSVTPSSVKVAWNRPPAVFDSYRLTIVTSGTTIGSCMNVTTLDPTETEITCEGLESCTNVNVTVFTQNSTSSELSAGVAFNNIQVPGKEPEPPLNFTFNPVEARRTELHWSPPQVVREVLGPYEVTVCTNPDLCPSRQRGDCREETTPDNSLVLSTMPVTKYCVAIYATASCDRTTKVLKSHALAKTFMTPPFAPGNFTVTATATSPTSIRLNVDPPRERNGNLDGCYAKCFSHDIEQATDCSPDDKIIDLDDLVKSSNYTCRVTFFNNHDGRRLETKQEVGVSTPNGADQQSSHLWIVFLLLSPSFTFAEITA